MPDVLHLLQTRYRRLSKESKGAIEAIHRLTADLVREEGEVKMMHVCGTHEDTVTGNGLRSLMPRGLKLIAGPGCPVCVTPASVIDAAIDLAEQGARIYSYGDLYKVPGTNESLAQSRANRGCDIRVVYSFLDAARISKEERKEAVFLAVGFETTAPTVASLVSRGKLPENLSIISSYRLTAPGLNHAMELHKEKGIPLRGVIAPGHVSTIIGARAWEYLPREYGLPTVVAGFEPVDMIFAVFEILRQLAGGEVKLVNEYIRAVSWEGNERAWNYVRECFDVCDAHWRGIGVLKYSGLRLKDEFRALDAEAKYDLDLSVKGEELRKGCRCAEVTLGLASPTDCPLFLKACTPGHPIGPCMVSVEGTCSVWARFGSEEAIQEIMRGAGLQAE